MFGHYSEEPKKGIDMTSSDRWAVYERLAREMLQDQSTVDALSQGELEELRLLAAEKGDAPDPKVTAAEAKIRRDMGRAPKWQPPVLGSASAGSLIVPHEDTDSGEERACHVLDDFSRYVTDDGTGDTPTVQITIEQSAAGIMRLAHCLEAIEDHECLVAWSIVHKQIEVITEALYVRARKLGYLD